jgi:hypothetical protein
MDVASARQLMQDRLQARFQRVAHLFPDEVPLASSAGGFESYKSEDEYRKIALVLSRDGDYVLTDRTLIFMDPSGVVKFRLDQIADFEPTLRLERGSVRRVKVRMTSGQVHQFAAAATFVDEVLATLGRPNATEGLLQLAAGELPVTKECLHIGGTLDGDTEADRYPVGDYDVLLMRDRLLAWTAPGNSLTLALSDIKQWRETGHEVVAAYLTFQDGTARMLTLSGPFAKAIRKAARVRRRRLKT